MVRECAKNMRIFLELTIFPGEDPPNEIQWKILHIEKVKAVEFGHPMKSVLDYNLALRRIPIMMSTHWQGSF